MRFSCTVYVIIEIGLLLDTSMIWRTAAYMPWPNDSAIPVAHEDIVAIF